MGANEKMIAEISADKQTLFNIQVCSKTGQLLNEYTLSQETNNVATLNAAEHHARENLSDYHGESLILLVSEETLTKFRQVQLEVFSKHICSE